MPETEAAQNAAPPEQTPEEDVRQEAEDVTGEVPAETEAAEEDAETEMEASEEAEAAETEETESGEEVPAQEETPKKSRMPIVIGVVIALLLIVIVCMGMALKTVSSGGKLPTLSSLFAEKFHGDAIAANVVDETGNTVAEINNSEFALYYWGEYFYNVNYYGGSIDMTKPLEEQTYGETTDDAGETKTITWKEYFVSTALDSMKQTYALLADAQEKGFTMPEDYQAEYDQLIGALDTNAASAGFVDENGNGDALAYVQDSYGTGVTLEDFKDYLYDSYLATAYSDSIYYGFSYEDADLDSYYDERADYFQGYGIEKSDTPNVNVRHILIEPEKDEEGAVSEEADETAKTQAEALLQEWQEGEATEDSFAALATENSTDSGSAANGGLYEGVYPGQMVPEFNDWCFDQSRQPGDVEIVKTDFGYHIIYFVDKTDIYYWKTAVESEKRYADYSDYTAALLEKFTVAETDKLQIFEPDAVKSIREQAAAAQTSPETETQTATETETQSSGAAE